MTEQIKPQQVHKIMLIFSYSRHPQQLTQKFFVNCFGKVGYHLFAKYWNLDCDLFALYCYLDCDNRAKFCDYIANIKE